MKYTFYSIKTRTIKIKHYISLEYFLTFNILFHTKSEKKVIGR